MSQVAEVHGVQLENSVFGATSLAWAEWPDENGKWTLLEGMVEYQNDRACRMRPDRPESACGSFLRGALYNVLSGSASSVEVSAENFQALLLGFQREVVTAWANEGMTDKTFSFESFNDGTSFAHLEKSGEAGSGTKNMEEWLGKHQQVTAFLLRHATRYLTSLQEDSSLLSGSVLDKAGIEDGMQRTKVSCDLFHADNQQLLEKIEELGAMEKRSCDPGYAALARCVAGLDHGTVMLRPYDRAGGSALYAMLEECEGMPDEDESSGDEVAIYDE